MTIENVKGVIWDLDGTLLDSFGIFEEIIGDVVASTGRELPLREVMINNYHGSLEETIQKILGIESVEELDEVIKTFLSKQERHYAGDLETHLFTDAALLAQKAASLGIQQLLVTNRAHIDRGKASPRHIIEATTLVDYIHEVNPGDEVEYRKPDVRSTGDWMERHNLSADEVVVIGDQFVDAELANNIGARAILVQRNNLIPHLETLQKQPIIVESLESIEFTTN